MEVSEEMRVSDRIEALRAQHADLEERLSAEAESTQPDPVVISDLKKQKLRIKDQMAALGDH